MKQISIAHYRESDQKIQSVSEHLKSVSRCCGKLADKIGPSTAGMLLGLLRDLGKYSGEFQAYIKSATGMLDPDMDADYVGSRGLRGKLITPRLAPSGSGGDFADTVCMDNWLGRFLLSVWHLIMGDCWIACCLTVQTVF